MTCAFNGGFELESLLPEHERRLSISKYIIDRVAEMTTTAREFYDEVLETLSGSSQSGLAVGFGARGHRRNDLTCVPLEPVNAGWQHMAHSG